MGNKKITVGLIGAFCFILVCFIVYVFLITPIGVSKDPRYDKKYLWGETYHYPPKAHVVDTFTITGGTFNVDVKVIITTDIPAALAYVKENIDSAYTPKDFDARGITFYQYGYPIVLWLPEIPSTTEQLSIFNHEASHVVWDIMQNAGVEMSAETDEVYAHETQRISKQFYEHIRGPNHYKPFLRLP